MTEMLKLLCRWKDESWMSQLMRFHIQTSVRQWIWMLIRYNSCIMKQLWTISWTLTVRLLSWLQSRRLFCVLISRLLTEIFVYFIRMGYCLCFLKFPSCLDGTFGEILIFIRSRFEIWPLLYLSATMKFLVMVDFLVDCSIIEEHFRNPEINIR